MTTDELYARLRAQAVQERGSSQVWHEADIDGHHLYMADTSFGDGPTFRYDNHRWQIAYGDTPITRDTAPQHLEEALALAERAEWHSRFEDVGVFRTDSGKVLTDDDIERLSEEAEKGYDISRLTRRSFVISVKAPSGDWSTYEAIELRIAEPIVMSSDTAGVVTINKATTPTGRIIHGDATG